MPKRSITKQLADPALLVPLTVLGVLVLLALNALSAFTDGDGPAARIAGAVREAIIKTFLFAVAIASFARFALLASNPWTLGAVAFGAFTLSGGWNDVAGVLGLPKIGGKSASGHNDAAPGGGGGGGGPIDLSGTYGQ